MDTKHIYKVSGVDDNKKKTPTKIERIKQVFYPLMYYFKSLVDGKRIIPSCNTSNNFGSDSVVAVGLAVVMVGVVVAEIVVVVIAEVLVLVEEGVVVVLIVVAVVVV